MQTYGPPSKFGFKDVINEWKADKWDPQDLIGRFKRAGAKFFVQMANHHDNCDMWDSTFQPWNSVKIGPKKDIVGLWAKYAREAGLLFGVTVHCRGPGTGMRPPRGATRPARWRACRTTAS